MKELEIFIFSFFSSTIAPILGIGGGNLNVPFLTLYAGVPFQEAVTASLLSGVFISASASIYGIRNGKTYVKTALKLLPMIILGALISAYVPLETRWLFLLFGISAMLTSYIMLYESDMKLKIKHPVAFNLFLFLVGLISGMLGIGGGAVFVPVLMFTQNLGIKRAVATSSFMTIFGMSVAFLSHAAHGDMNISVAIPLAIPALFMGYIGSYLMIEKIKRRTMRRVLAIFLFIIALMMSSKAF